MAFLSTNFGTLTTTAVSLLKANGVPAPTTFHIVIDVVSVTLNVSGTGSATVTLVGNAVFTGVSTYAVATSLPPGATSNATVNTQNTSGTAFIVEVVGDSAHAGTIITIPFVAIGT